MLSFSFMAKLCLLNKTKLSKIYVHVQICFNLALKITKGLSRIITTIIPEVILSTH